MKLLGIIQEINPCDETRGVPGKPKEYRVKLKVKNTFHPQIKKPKGIGRRVFYIKRAWIYPFIPERGNIIQVDSEEFDIGNNNIRLSGENISAEVMQFLGGRIFNIKYGKNKPIYTPVLYGRDLKLAAAGIFDSIGKKRNISALEFELEEKSDKRAILKTNKKGWGINKEIEIRDNFIKNNTRITKYGRKKEESVIYSQTFNLIPDIRKLKIYIPTENKDFIYTPQPYITPWQMSKTFYGLKDGLVIKYYNTYIGWTMNTENINHVKIKEEEWLIKISIIQNKLKIKKKEKENFKSLFVFGEDCKINERGICIIDNGESTWVKNGTIIN